jgi:tetratricopeptide (TPR) repeat protein
MTSTPTPKFSICVVGKNEEKVLPRLLSSIKDFLDAGGDFHFVDTGSDDSTPDMVVDAGGEVWYSGDRFTRELNDTDPFLPRVRRFTLDDPDTEKGYQLIRPVSYFDFGTARNYAIRRAKTEWVLMLDCDEQVTHWDIAEINKCCEQKEFGSYTYCYVWSHTEKGRPDRVFDRPYFVNQSATHFEGIAHEAPICSKPTGKLGSHLIVDHFPEKTDRTAYNFPALAIQAWRCPRNARYRYYLARELMYAGCYDSAMKHFSVRESLDGWGPERAQSFIYHGDCYKKVGRPALAAGMYRASIGEDPNRREPWLAMSQWCKDQNQPQACAAYASAALAIDRSTYWDEAVCLYRGYPHHLLYWAYYQLPNQRMRAKAHWTLAMDSDSENPVYKADSHWFV